MRNLLEILQNFSEDYLSPSHYWVVGAQSLTDFQNSVVELNIPIDSNLMLYIGATEHYLEIWDVYRPQPGGSLR